MFKKSNTDNKNKTLESDRQLFRFFGVASGAILAVWFLTFAVVTAIGAYEISGPFGDSFGAVNALFTGRAFAAVVATQGDT